MSGYKKKAGKADRIAVTPPFEVNCLAKQAGFSAETSRIFCAEGRADFTRRLM